MRTITLEQPGTFRAGESQPPQPSVGEARVRVRRIGVCGTDLHAFAGRQPFFTYPRILGHELGVIVESVPEGETRVRPGDRCCVEPYLSCGRCKPCWQGKTNCCESLQVLGVHTDGGMRESINVPVDRLYPSRDLSLDQLVLVETLGIGQHAVERADIRPGEEVLVVGAGPIGLAVVQFARAAGGDVLVLERSPQRRFFAERFGVPSCEDVGDRLFDVVFDATGNSVAMEQSVERVAFGGKLIFVGIVPSRISFDDPLFHRREMTILASRNSAGAFPGIMADIAAGRIDTTPWITDRLELSEVPAVFAELPRRPGLIKAMIEVS